MNARRTAHVVAMERLRQRAEFLAAAAGRKVPTECFVLQARERGDQGPARVGFTVSKKVGTAVERNRVRRRLREAACRTGRASMRPGHDYVLVGRRTALQWPFEQLTLALESALCRAHRSASKGRPPGSQAPYRPQTRPDQSSP